MLWVYLCWRGGDRGNLSVVLSVLMINWLPSSFFPLLQLAWQKTPKLAPTSNKKTMKCGEWVIQTARATVCKVMLSSFSDSLETKAKQSSCFGTSECSVSSRIQTKYLNPGLNVMSNGTMASSERHCPSPPLSWNRNSHRAPQWERKWVWGIVHDINPPKHNHSRQDPIQTGKHNVNQQSIY